MKVTRNFESPFLFNVIKSGDAPEKVHPLIV